MDVRDTDDYKGASFHNVDLSGATFRDCDFTGVRIVSTGIDDVVVNGFAGHLGTIVVNDVDVTAYVQDQLDKRHPERVQLRAMATAADYRAMWVTVEGLWSRLLDRAEALTEEQRQTRIDGEWSLVETLRHLAFAIDTWVGNMIRGEADPWHSLGLPPTDYGDSNASAIGIDVTAQVTFADTLTLYDRRRALMREVVAAVTDAELEEVRDRAPAPAWGPEPHSVAECLRVVMNEHCQHYGFATRDLDRLLLRDQGRLAIT